jgi:hypothetical protein
MVSPMPIEDPDRKTVAQAVRAYIAKERISREEFAQRTKLGKSTVDKLVVGLFSEKTVMQVESQLGINLRRSSAEIADAELGGYSREEVQRYVGDYIFVRPSFREEAGLHAFPMRIEWDHAFSSLLIKERTRNKETLQFGRIYIPRASRHIFILSNERGWLKTTILSRFDAHKKMKGVMLTLGRAFGNLYLPMAMPVIMNKCDKIEDEAVGKVVPGAPSYIKYSKELAEVEEDQFARWIALKRG